MCCDLFLFTMVRHRPDPKNSIHLLYNRAATCDFTINLTEQTAIKEPRLRSNRKQTKIVATQKTIYYNIFWGLK